MEGTKEEILDSKDFIEPKRNLKRNHEETNKKEKQSTNHHHQLRTIPTATQYIIPPSQYLTLPPELQSINFTNRISWRKYKPYNPSKTLAFIPPHTKPTFPNQKYSPALELHVHALSKRARATTVHLPRGRSVETPIFMPVGTKGTIKALTTEEIYNDSNSSTCSSSTCSSSTADSNKHKKGDKNAITKCPIILGNTYHLALQPGTELIEKMGGLHTFMNWNHGGILTDSGGFQMVSLLKLAEITEEGVTFENPFEQKDEEDDDDDHDSNNEIGSKTCNDNKASSERMLLRPEDSITHQNNIGSDIMMALDDVVSSVTDNDERFTIATYRTLRWLDRCISAHTKPQTQNLFAIVQGGLDTSIGGLREKCLAGFMSRDDNIPGYAIGGLAGGESKDDFWKVVDQCCKALPDDKPRYLMGVGYPLDLVVCTALGVDMYDCVYPTRTARFGVALVPTGAIRLKSNEYYNDHGVIMEECQCLACRNGYTRSQLHTLLKRGNPFATSLMTHHNIAYMMYLVRGMREAILEDRYEEYVIDFMKGYFAEGDKNGKRDIPQWVRDALDAAGISLDVL